MPERYPSSIASLAERREQLAAIVSAVLGYFERERRPPSPADFEMLDALESELAALGARMHTLRRFARPPLSIVTPPKEGAA
ncbi:MAG: hypothetical protein FWD12_08680 [Alphaproteobacteria bacterium]|nr:hypothetical protein [Alphaproteobacteria bacterium]